MLLRTVLEQSRIFIHFWIREDDWGGGERDLIRMQSGGRPLEGAPTRESSADSGWQRELGGEPATTVRLVSKGHGYSGVRAGGGIAPALRAHAQESVLRTLLPHKKLLRRGNTHLGEFKPQRNRSRPIGVK